MPLLLGPLVTWLGAVVARFFTDSLLKFAAYKIFAFSLITVTLPIVLKNLISWLYETVYAVITANVDTSGLGGVVIELTGLAGFLGDCLRFPECLSVVMTACALKFVLKLIPFVG